MDRILVQIAAALACLCFLFAGNSGCSQNGANTNGEEGRVEKLTDRTAAAAATKIRTPLDKARKAAAQGEERAGAMERAVRQQ